MARSKLWIFLLAGLVILAGFSVFTVDERERALRLRLGRVVEADYAPGLYFKLPLFDKIRFFDRRIQTLDAEPEPFLTSEKKNVIVDSFVKWRIGDVVRFYTATGGSKSVAEARLEQFVKKGMKDEFGKRTIQEVIAGERSEIMRKLSGVRALTPGASQGGAQGGGGGVPPGGAPAGEGPAAGGEVAAGGQPAPAPEGAAGPEQRTLGENAVSLGIEVVDVRIKRIDLPEGVSNSVYRRMQAERQRVAREFRSRGHEVAKRIRAEAEKKREVILAEAQRDADRTRGRGDAVAADTYAQAYRQDPDFYSFYRSLTAYRNSFRDRSDVLLLDTKNDFFRFLKDPNGQR